MKTIKKTKMHLNSNIDRYLKGLVLPNAHFPVEVYLPEASKAEHEYTLGPDKKWNGTGRVLLRFKYRGYNFFITSLKGELVCTCLITGSKVCGGFYDLREALHASVKFIHGNYAEYLIRIMKLKKEIPLKPTEAIIESELIIELLILGCL